MASDAKRRGHNGKCTTDVRCSVPPEQLAWRCDPSSLGFETTAELEPLSGTVGQERAIQALQFGIDVQAPGYNLFLAGSPGTGRWRAARAQIEARARSEPKPPDWCYVHNFETPDEPTAISLPAGQGQQLASDMEELVSLSQEAIFRAFQGDDYEERKSAIVHEYSERRDALIEELQGRAKEMGFMLQMGPAGVVTVPLSEGQPLTPEQYEELPEEKKQEIEARGRDLPSQIEQMFRQVRALDREAQEKVRELDQSIAGQAVAGPIENLRRKYEGNEKVVRFVDAAGKDISENVDEFRDGNARAQMEGPPGANMAAAVAQMQREETMSRYKVNVFVDNSDTDGAPVICEDHPTYYNLIGKIDFRVRLGVMDTDPTMIRAGSLHKASGGYLVVDVQDLLTNPLAYDGLKRALRTGEVRIENLGEQLGLIPTATLKPDPIAISTKVVLIGSPFLYYLLYSLDQDFGRLFKVRVDFDNEMSRSDIHLAQYAALVAALTRRDGMRPFTSGAVARAAEFAARLREHQGKLATSYRAASDLVTESSFWACKAGHDTVTAEDVQSALDAREYRSRMIEEKIQELIAEGTLMVDLTGETIGQVNGLSVSQLGDYSFGRPSRITARTYLGRAGVVNVEREVELGGRIHNKGVLILSGYLGGKYARDVPMALATTLTFEQLYEEVEGDSASSAELYAVLSSLADLPLKQGIAVTGSVNQRGEIQPIGGVTEKVEGFFHICKIKGLTGRQGVIIPYQNVKNLMLKDEVIQAVRDGQFGIWAVHSVDEGIEILTGVPAGRQYPDGSFEENSINDRVMWRIRRFAETMKEYSTDASEGDGRAQKELAGAGRRSQQRRRGGEQKA